MIDEGQTVTQLLSLLVEVFCGIRSAPGASITHMQRFSVEQAGESSVSQQESAPALLVQKD